MKRWLLILGLVLLVTAGLFILTAPDAESPTSNTNPSQATDSGPTVVADNLEIPWEVAFLPDGRMLVTERPGRVRTLKDGKLQPEPILTIQTTGSGEGGLQGLAIDPDFTTNHFVYLYVSEGSGDSLINRIVRYTERSDKLVEPRTLVDNIPGNNNHNGGRLAFGPDKLLYVTTGDSQEPSLAQDRNSLAGKILRIKTDGSPAPDNPFGNMVYSYGHRNPQGLAWDDKGSLYSTEHGPSGDLGLCCRDELNRIEKGGNYGWPEVSGENSRDPFIAPIASSGTRDTWAPAGLAFHDGKLYFANLRGSHLRVITLQDGKVTDQREMLTELGRLRAAVFGPDGFLYVTTSNRDGRGDTRDGDDKLLKLRV